jgi:hypothetical protein
MPRASARRNTGRTDKYSEGTPREAYKKYREDNPAKKTARAEMAKNGRIETQKKTAEVKKQELISLIQNSPGAFGNSVEQSLFKEGTIKALQDYYKSIPVL